MAKLTKKDSRQKRHYKLRKTVQGTAARPRFSVFKSNTNIYVQIIDDSKGHTLVSVSSKSLKIANGSNIEAAKKVGAEAAKKAKAANINEVVFDRGGFLYHGRISAVADAAREEGLKI